MERSGLLSSSLVLCLLLIFSIGTFLTGGVDQVTGISSPDCSGTRNVNITSDTIWNTDMLVPDNITVMGGVTLTVAPGVTVEFVRDRFLELRPGSSLIARGTKESPIEFKLNEPTSGDIKWHGIRITEGQMILENTTVTDSIFGVSSSYNSEVIIGNCTFTGLYTGISASESNLTIRDSTFIDNPGTGIRSEYCNLIVRDSLFMGNEEGIFAGICPGFEISGSDFVDNLLSDISVQDFIDIGDTGRASEAADHPFLPVERARITGNVFENSREDRTVRTSAIDAFSYFNCTLSENMIKGGNRGVIWNVNGGSLEVFNNTIICGLSAFELYSKSDYPNRISWNTMLTTEFQSGPILDPVIDISLDPFFSYPTEISHNLFDSASPLIASDDDGSGMRINIWEYNYYGNVKNTFGYFDADGDWIVDKPVIIPGASQEEDQRAYTSSSIEGDARTFPQLDDAVRTSQRDDVVRLSNGKGRYGNQVMLTAIYNSSVEVRKRLTVVGGEDNSTALYNHTNPLRFIAGSDGARLVDMTLYGSELGADVRTDYVSMTNVTAMECTKGILWTGDKGIISRSYFSDSFIGLEVDGAVDIEARNLYVMNSAHGIIIRDSADVGVLGLCAERGISGIYSVDSSDIYLEGLELYDFQYGIHLSNTTEIDLSGSHIFGKESALMVEKWISNLTVSYSFLESEMFGASLGNRNQGMDPNQNMVFLNTTFSANTGIECREFSGLDIINCTFLSEKGVSTWRGNDLKVGSSGFTGGSFGLHLNLTVPVLVENNRFESLSLSGIRMEHMEKGELGMVSLYGNSFMNCNIGIDLDWVLSCCFHDNDYIGCTVCINLTQSRNRVAFYNETFEGPGITIFAPPGSLNELDLYNCSTSPDKVIAYGSGGHIDFHYGAEIDVVDELGDGIPYNLTVVDSSLKTWFDRRVNGPGYLFLRGWCYCDGGLVWGSHNYTFKAWNDLDSVSIERNLSEFNSISMILDSTPTAAPIPDLIMDEDSSIGVNLSDHFTDKDALSYLASGTYNLSLDLSLGEFDWLYITPAENWSGEETVNVRAIDTFNKSVELGIHVTVRPVNDPPVLIRPIPPASMLEDDVYNLNLSGCASDVDGDTLRWYNGTAENCTLVWDGSGMNISVTPKTNWFGSLGIPLFLTDGGIEVPFTWDLEVEPVNDPPLWSGHDLWPLQINRGERIRLSLVENLTDVDSDLQEFTVTTNSTYVVYTAGWLEIFYPNETGLLGELVQVTVIDGNESLSFVLNISIQELESVSGDDGGGIEPALIILPIIGVILLAGAGVGWAAISAKRKGDIDVEEPEMDEDEWEDEEEEESEEEVEEEEEEEPESEEDGGAEEEAEGWGEKSDEDAPEEEGWGEEEGDEEGSEEEDWDEEDGWEEDEEEAPEEEDWGE